MVEKSERRWRIKYCNIRNWKKQDIGKTIANVFEAIAEEHLMQPTIIYEFPTAVSRSPNRNRTIPTVTERFEMFAGQMEIANGFSELNDPEDQPKVRIAIKGTRARRRRSPPDG